MKEIDMPNRLADMIVYQNQKITLAEKSDYLVLMMREPCDGYEHIMTTDNYKTAIDKKQEIEKDALPEYNDIHTI